MYKDMFINITILIASLSILSQIFRNQGISSFSTKPIRLYMGFLCGGIGIILMLFGVHVTPTIILDFRTIALIVSAIQGGLLAVIISGLMIGTFRILYFGLNFSSIIATVVIIVIVTGTGVVSKLSVQLKQKWSISIVFCLFVNTIAILFLIDNPTVLKNIFISYYLGTGIIAILLYHYLKYLESSNYLYRKYRDDAKKDYLTSLNNVREFDIIFNAKIRQANNQKSFLSLLLIDIDFFKTVNDNYGHSEGDIVLKELSSILIKICPMTDCIFRNGGEEFSVILENIDSDQAVEMAEQIRKTVESHQFKLSKHKTVKITVSIGVVCSDGTQPAAELIDKADEALYCAKHNGRNKVVLANINVS